MNNLSLFEPEEKTMTTREVAETLGVSVEAVQKGVKKLAENNTRLFESIKRNNQGGYLFNEAQVTAIKLELESHSKVNALTPKTQLEKQLLIQQAMQLQQEMITELQQRVEVAENALARIADGKGCYSLAQTAKALKLPYGRNTLNDKLKQMGLFLASGEPYQEQINAGHFKVVVKYVNDFVGNKPVTLTTGKGLVYLAKRFNTELDENIKADA